MSIRYVYLINWENLLHATTKIAIDAQKIAPKKVAHKAAETT